MRLQVQFCTSVEYVVQTTPTALHNSEYVVQTPPSTDMMTCALQPTTINLAKLGLRKSINAKAEANRGTICLVPTTACNAGAEGPCTASCIVL
jgi:hypothetical protein